MRMDENGVIVGNALLREMSPIERSVLPPTLRTRSANGSVIANSSSPCLSSSRW
jgi:hypothetical protein